MPAEVISLCDYRKKKDVREKSSDADCKGEVIDLADARRLKSARETGKTFKGTNFPLDYLVGPDEPGEDFGSLLMNLSLDNPNFPYDPLPKEEDMAWVKGIMDEEEKE